MPNHNPFDLPPGERPTLPPLPPPLKKKGAEPVVELPSEELHDLREPGTFQENDVEPAFEVPGFTGMEVIATIEKKDSRKKKPTDRNQDNIIADPDSGLLGVFDGLGGHPNGDLASKIAERVLPEAFFEAQQDTKDMPPDRVAQKIADQQFDRLTIRDRHQAHAVRLRMMNAAKDIAAIDPDMARRALALIRAFQSTSDDVRATRGETTACAGFIHKAPDGTRYAVVANTGDSAAFIRRANGTVIRLTREDSYLIALQEAGYLPDAMLKRMKANPAREFPLKTPNGQQYYSYPRLQASVVSTLGSKDSSPSLAVERLQPGDELIFITDGGVDKLDDPDTDETDLVAFAKAMNNGKTLAERTNAFRRAVKILKTYKSDDDIAMVVARMMDGE